MANVSDLVETILNGNREIGQARSKMVQFANAYPDKVTENHIEAMQGLADGITDLAVDFKTVADEMKPPYI